MSFKLFIPMLLCFFWLQRVKSQLSIGKDTIYYYLDTLKVPINERMMTTKTYMDYKFYTINCYCLEAYRPPVFRSNVTKNVLITKRDFKGLKFINLPGLISLVKENDNNHFDDRFVIYFIEPAGPKYMKQKVFFLGGHATVVE